MCIRDRSSSSRSGGGPPRGPARARRSSPRAWPSARTRGPTAGRSPWTGPRWTAAPAVSYTHLTLPTICSV
eukprot:943713-Alexandrium_andersonii.AAC.1